MDNMISAIDPLYALGNNVNMNKVGSRADAEKQFVSFFLSEIFKDVFKAQSSMFGEEGSSVGTFSNNLYNDILMSHITKEIADSKVYGMDKLLAKMNKK